MDLFGERDKLSPRAGVRPRTRHGLPQVQFDQWPPPELILELVERSLKLPHVGDRQSRMAAQDTHALWLPDEYSLGPADAFIDDHEFCHIHPLPEGSIHLTLAEAFRKEVIRLGWGEPHPSAEAGFLPKTLILVYAPRDRTELEVAVKLIYASYRFAKGESSNGCSSKGR